MPPNTDTEYSRSSDHQQLSPGLQSGSAQTGGDQDLGAITDLSGQSLVLASTTIGALTTMAQTSQHEN